MKLRICYLSCIFLLVAYLTTPYFGKISPLFLGVASSLLVLSSAAFFVVLMAKMGKLSFGLGLILFWLVNNISVFSNWWYFQYFQSFYNYEALRFGTDVLESFRSLSAFQYKVESIVVSVVTLGLTLSAISFYRKPFFSNQVFLASSLVFFSIFSFSLYFTFSQINNLKKVNIFNLSPSYLHPLHAFSMGTGGGLDPGDRQVWDRFRAYNTNIGRRFINLEQSNGNYNVILVVMESFRASLTGIYGDGASNTPNFDKISKENILVENFYANSTLTLKSEIAILCGVYDNNARPSIAEYSGEKNLNCLPHILSKLNYSSYYFHGNRSSFYNRESFIPELGFKNRYFHLDESPNRNDGREYIGWGLSDEDMFHVSLSRLEESYLERNRQPFFAHIMTLSNHYPFNYQWPIEVPYETYVGKSSLSKNEVYTSYKNGVFYSDYALGKFWEQFQKSPLKNNTIVLITADHGVSSFPEENYSLESLYKNDIFFRMPLAIYHPDVKGPVVIEQLSNQIDIPLTILDMLDIDPQQYNASYVGKSIFEKVEKPWSVMMRGGLVSLKIDNKYCVLGNARCGGVQQDCLSKTTTDLSYLQEKKYCAVVSGDLLNNGIVKKIEEDIGLLDNAFKLVRYENNRLLESD